MGEHSGVDESRVVSDEEYQAYLDNGPRADDWQKFIMDGDSNALARYLRLGGDVDDNVRAALITYIEANPRREVGGSKKYRDYLVACHVKSEQTKDTLPNSRPDQEGVPRLKPRSVRKILAVYAAEHNAELRTVEKQYERGRKIFQKSQRNAPETPE